jgi:quercetin dioxygenase-like cupin family protein
VPSQGSGQCGLHFRVGCGQLTGARIITHSDTISTKEAAMRRHREGLRAGTLLFVGIITAAVTVAAQAPPAKTKAMTAPQGADAQGITWGMAPPSLPPGASFAVLTGDPAKAGELFIVRLKAPDGYRVAPHTHPGDEHVTVLKGTFVVGMGEKWDDKAMKTFAVGMHTMAPKDMPHFATFRGETILEIVGIGPFAMKYVNPADDPSLKKTAQR